MSEIDPEFLARLRAKMDVHEGRRLTARTASGREECRGIVASSIAAGLLAHGPKQYVPNRIEGKRARFGY